jgi:hypothetical protein
MLKKPKKKKKRGGVLKLVAQGDHHLLAVKKNML